MKIAVIYQTTVVQTRVFQLHYDRSSITVL